MQYIQTSDLVRQNRALTGDRSVGDPDAGMGGLDWKQLVAAVERHQGKVEFYPDSVDERGAVLLDSLLEKQPFARMNKQTAVLALYAFYRLNGYDLDISSTEFMEYVEGGRLPSGSAGIAVYLGRHRTPHS